MDDCFCLHQEMSSTLVHIKSSVAYLRRKLHRVLVVPLISPVVGRDCPVFWVMPLEFVIGFLESN